MQEDNRYWVNKFGRMDQEPEMFTKFHFHADIVKGRKTSLLKRFRCEEITNEGVLCLGKSLEGLDDLKEIRFAIFG